MTKTWTSIKVLPQIGPSAPVTSGQPPKGRSKVVLPRPSIVSSEPPPNHPINARDGQDQAEHNGLEDRTKRGAGRSDGLSRWDRDSSFSGMTGQDLAPARPNVRKLCPHPFPAKVPGPGSSRPTHTGTPTMPPTLGLLLYPAERHLLDGT